MNKLLSDGVTPNTLGGYLSIAIALFGNDSKPAKFFMAKIAMEGADMEVMADETQVISIIMQLGLAK